MNNIFVDAGSYDGDSIEQFKNWRKIAFPDKEDWIIYGFEPNPKFRDKLEALASDKVIISNRAAWIEYHTTQFALESSETPLGSTLMSGKKKIWDNNEKIDVQAFDFSAWLRQFEDDFVVVKMDIEGAEFPILEKMIADGTDKICDYLMVEFHPNKVVEYTTTDKNILIDKLKSRGVNILEWH